MERDITRREFLGKSARLGGELVLLVSGGELLLGGCATALRYQNVDRSKEGSDKIEMYPENQLEQRLIRKKRYCIKVVPEEEKENMRAEINGQNIPIINNRYLIPIDDEETIERIGPSSATIENETDRYFLVPVKENASGVLEVDYFGPHEQSDVTLKTQKGICPNKIAKQRKKGIFGLQRDIEKRIRNFSELNHGEEIFKAVEINRTYLTDADIENLGYVSAEGVFGKEILPMIFLRGKITPELEIQHHNNGTVDLAEKVYAEQFLLMRGKMVKKPKGKPTEEKKDEKPQDEISH